jgi:hypothetical protein
MATYQIAPDRFAVARAEDLLYVEIEVQANNDVLALALPPQHVLEFPFRPQVPPFLPAPSSDGEQGFSSFLTYPISSAEEGRALATSLLEHFDGRPGHGAVEFPAMMLLEPTGHSTWSLCPRPRTGAGWSAVWQAELLATAGPDTLPGPPWPLVRVTATQDPQFEPASFGVFPFVLFPEFRGATFRARLAVSMLGVSGRLRGPVAAALDPIVPVTVADYDHVAQFGRDQKVTAVVRGFLSSGHPAELEVVTTRVFAQMTFQGVDFPPSIDFGQGGSDADPYKVGETYFSAFLEQSATLTVLEPQISFDGIDTPFRTLRLSDERLGQVDPNPAEAFWVTRGGQDVHFALVGADWEGREVPFSAPLMFLRGGADGGEVFRAAPPARTTVNLGGAPVALADRGGHADVAPDAVRLPVHALSFDLVPAALGAGSVIVPKTVEVALDAVGRLAGSAERTKCELLHRLDEAGTFLHIPDGLPVSFPAEQVGGLASPNAVLGAVNALRGAIPTGPVADVFGDANLLGVQLTTLLAQVQEEMPLLTSLQLPDALVTSYDWTPALDPGDGTGVIRLAADSTLHLHASATQPLDPSAAEPRPPATTVTGTLTHATLSLLGVIEVTFGKLEFIDEPEATPKIRATGVAVSFKEDLRFVEDLAKEIADFADGCPVKVDSSGITAGYALAIPAVAFGVFSLANIRLEAQVRIPFTGEPASVRFNFAERHSPFTVAVNLFSGGGFFGVEATTKELQRVEGSLEFGGSFEIGLVVAQGQVFAMGGVSFLRAGDTISLEGYLRCGGHLEILDVVGVSVEFQVALRYTDDGGSPVVQGSATLTVGVEVLLFHESVTFTVEKSFSAGDVAEPVEDLLDDAAFEQLCEAFA